MYTEEMLKYLTGAITFNDEVINTTLFGDIKTGEVIHSYDFERSANNKMMSMTADEIKGCLYEYTSIIKELVKYETQQKTIRSITNL